MAERAERPLGDRLRDAVNRRIFAEGARLAPRLTPGQVERLTRRVGRAAVGIDYSYIRQYRTNLTLATGREPSRDLLVAGVASYLRNYIEVLALPAWSHDTILAKVYVEPHGLATIRQAYAERRAVVALPHSGNWDLAGAWACLAGMPVTTVAEQLGEAEYAAYTKIRNRLGMTVYPHNQPDVLPTLTQAVRDHRLVCLVADRNFGRGGVPVQWRDQRVRMPAGPAEVARRSGAYLFGVACHYAPRGMVMEFSEPIAPAEGASGLASMTQRLAGFFAGQVAAHPQDWHLMQPFFEQPRSLSADSSPRSPR